MVLSLCEEAASTNGGHFNIRLKFITRTVSHKCFRKVQGPGSYEEMGGGERDEAASFGTRRIKTEES